ncbi:MAG: DUF3786 domain-containing protein [Desulforhabdus sp.]|nr:DUF3786 domain-containing protein [Desulforhabdus sp.]
MARIDDYKESFRLATEALKKANLHRLAKLSGAIIENKHGATQLHLLFLGESFVIRVDEQVDVHMEGTDNEVSLPAKILICHYLLNALSEADSGELITFREIPDGHFYFDAFQRRARDPFLATFGQQPDLFRRCSQLLGGESVGTGDVGMKFQVLPHISIQLALWEGDEEFPPEASILFDSSIEGRLPVEDIAVLTGMLIYGLMGIARDQQG